jgi:Xaa-Pro aminopeptidase
MQCFLNVEETRVQNIDFAHRIEKIRARMDAQGLDVLVATKLGSRHYLAGAMMPWRSAIVIPRKGDVSLTTTSIDSERVAYDTWINCPIAPCRPP